MGLVSCSDPNETKQVPGEFLDDAHAIEIEETEVEEAKVKDTSTYELEEVNYPEEAKIDMKLKKLQNNEILWEKSWTDIYLTELGPYSVLTHEHNRLYIVVMGMLYVIDENTGNNIFDPVRVGSCDKPYIDESGNIYCVDFYGPFATKVSPDGIAYDTVQLSKETGEIGNLYWMDVDGIIFEDVKVTSALENYPAGNLIDGLKETAWVEGEADYSLGESISFEHSSPVILSKIVIQNGYQKSQDLFNKNGRVRRVDIEFSSGEIYHYEFDDTMEPIIIMLEEPVETTSVTLTMQAVYPGSLYEDDASINV